MRALCVGLLGIAVAASASFLSFALSDDVLYAVEMVVSTTSDWTVVRVSGATLVVETSTVEQGVAAPGLHVWARTSLAVSKVSHDETFVTVRFRGFFANPTETAIQIWIGKGHIGDTTVGIYAVGGIDPIARFTHRGMAPGNPADNARTFSFLTSDLAPRIEPQIVPAPPTSPLGGQKVLAFYYPWYGTPTGPSGRWVHWNPAHANFDGTHVPAAGYYDSLDPETVRRHIREAREAGIDGFIASWWGLDSFEDRAFRVLLRVAEEEAFFVTVYYEDAATPAQIINDVGEIVSRYATSPAFLSIEGLPVVFFYVRVVQKFTMDEWSGVFAALAARDRSVFAIADRLDPTYLQAFQGLHVYTPVGMTFEDAAAQYAVASLAARIQGGFFAATVVPGYQGPPHARGGSSPAPTARRTARTGTWRGRASRSGSS